MNVLTLKVPDELAATLHAASRARGLSKSAVVREALEQSLGRQEEQAGAAERWLSQWRGRLSPLPAPSAARGGPQDDRLAHILAKHLS